MNPVPKTIKDLLLNQKQLTTIMSEISTVRAAVLGDFCLDAYFFLDSQTEEVSVETSLEVRGIDSFNFYPGGAGNVARNLAVLGVKSVSAFGITGNDIFGHHMIEILNSEGVNTDNIVFPDDRWNTNVYFKVYRNGREEPRMDSGCGNSLSDEISLSILQNLKKSINSFDILIINQQLKNGLHSPLFRKELKLFLESIDTIPVLMDSRDYNDFYGNTLRKLNEYEGSLVLGKSGCTPYDELSRKEAEETVCNLYDRWKKPVFLTRGDRGCLVCDGGTVSSIPGIHIPDSIDTVGAGDSMLAGIAAVIGSGGRPEDGAFLGNIAASITVRKLFQTGTANPEEIIKAGESPDYLYNQDSFSLSPIKLSPSGMIEIIANENPPSIVKYALFDHDGTISVLREGWEKLMKPMMMKAVLGERAELAGDKLRIEEQVDVFIEKTTGIQTIRQMQGLVEMVSREGFVASDRILTPEGYKEIYNKELLSMVDARISRINSGELDRSDFLIKGVISFLKELDRRGVILYLASGTDQEDVRREADFMGYGHLFRGGIYGSVGEPDKDPKRMVIREILSSIGPEKGSALAVFGDGPVEMRETKKAGGFCVGVISDEVRRFGPNPEKRNRLLLAGADILIPDFSSSCELLSLLFPGGGSGV